MPIYEYQCEACGKVLELLQRMGSTEAGEPCPVCGGTSLQRCLSVPAPARLASGGTPCGTGSGAPGGCGGGCSGCQ